MPSLAVVGGARKRKHHTKSKSKSKTGAVKKVHRKKTTHKKSAHKKVGGAKRRHTTKKVVKSVHKKRTVHKKKSVHKKGGSEVGLKTLKAAAKRLGIPLSFHGKRKTKASLSKAVAYRSSSKSSKSRK